MRNLLITALLITCLVQTSSIMGSPARRINISKKQTDGTTVVISQRGDEHFHYYVISDDELPVVRANDGNFYHAVIGDGSITASTFLAHEKGQRTATELEFIANRGDVTTALNNMRAARQKQKARTRAAKEQEITRYEGNKKALVILVNFQDNAFTIDNTQAYYKRMLNEYGFSDNGCYGSVSQYFTDQSNGVFNLSFDVAGPYTLSQKMAYYGGNDSDGDDLKPKEMIKEACRLADSDVDFSEYDWYGDGTVDLVYVIYAGYSEAQGASEETIWPHQWSVSGLELDGKTVSQYACSSELRDYTGDIPDGIGSLCHEFSHGLGLPDFYDTEYNGGFGMQSWSIMDYGSYNGPDGYGECPCNYTSYERWCCGWGEPTELSSPADITGMTSLDSGNEGYVIYNDGNRNEFYMLDNRQQTGWDTYLPGGHGMLVTHVDYNERNWFYNTVNTDPKHQRCTIISAGNIYEDNPIHRYKDPYPGRLGNTKLTNTSTPAATVYNQNTDNSYYMNKPITDITESEDGLISFKFMGGSASGISTVPYNNDENDNVQQWGRYPQLLPRNIVIERRNGKNVKVIVERKN